MKQIKRNLILCLLVLLVLTSTSATYAFWANDVQGSSSAATGQVSLGNWTFSLGNPQGIPLYNPQDTYATGHLVWFNGSIFRIRNGGYSSTPPDQNTVYGPYNEVTREWRITNTYQDNDVVYYQGAFYRVANSGQFNGSQLDSNPGWDQLNSIDWKSYKAYTTNNIVLFNGELYRATAGWTTGQPDQSGNWEKLNSFDWSPTRIYSTAGILVYYNGNYYTSNWYNVNVAPGSGGPWSLATIFNWGNRNFNLNDYALYNGNLYQAVGGNQGQRRNSEPGTLAAYGIWKRVDTQVWQQFNVYAVNEYVLYQGHVYQVANATNAVQTQPGTIYNAWNRVNTSEWQWYNVYSNGAYAFYQGIPYQVVNATNANNNVAPGSVSNAWNRIDSFHYQSFNLYQINDVVIYNNIAYRAIATSFGVIPGTPAAASIWALYSY